ncbi:hypothetical protein HDU96_007825 [Phlyctochytrium bullatum]|nr:hypothetical protein HDU96_007825 [Phlyctochytrium bullatum]
MDGLTTTLVSTRDDERLPTPELLESHLSIPHVGQQNSPSPHANRVVGIESIVILTPNVPFTVEGFTYFGWHPVSSYDDSRSGRRIVRFRTPNAGIEVVGPAIDYPLPKFRPGFNPNHPDLRPWETVKGDEAQERAAKEIRAITGPTAKFWGITFVTEDVSAAWKVVGGEKRAEKVRAAVQGGGRRFFALKETASEGARDGISVRIAFISPRPSKDDDRQCSAGAARL